MVDIRLERLGKDVGELRRALDVHEPKLACFNQLTKERDLRRHVLEPFVGGGRLAEEGQRPDYRRR